MDSGARGGRNNRIPSRISGCTLDRGIGGERGVTETETVGPACGAPAPPGRRGGGRVDIGDAGPRVVPEEPWKSLADRKRSPEP